MTNFLLTVLWGRSDPELPLLAMYFKNKLAFPTILLRKMLILTRFSF
jgi:hypothetical protein